MVVLPSASVLRTHDLNIFLVGEDSFNEVEGLLGLGAGNTIQKRRGAPGPGMKLGERKALKDEACLGKIFAQLFHDGRRLLAGGALQIGKFNDQQLGVRRPLGGTKGGFGERRALRGKRIGAEGENVAGDGVLQILGDIPVADLLALRACRRCAVMS